MTTESDIKRHRSAIQDLQRKIGQESSKVASARKKAANAAQAASRSTSQSTRASKLREVTREEARAVDAETKRAKLESQLAARTKQLHGAEAKSAKERTVAEAKRQRQFDEALRRSETQFRPTWSSHSQARAGAAGATSPPPTFDLFISHASEDKEEIARPLAKDLATAGLNVWYDAFTLKVGDSLRRKIDEGLSQSRFGVVILSPHFFAKDWPQRELDGLTAKAAASDQTVILPVWHHISKEEVLQHSPTLAGLMALNTAVMTHQEIVTQLVDRVRDA